MAREYDIINFDGLALADQCEQQHDVNQRETNAETQRQLCFEILYKGVGKMKSVNSFVHRTGALLRESDMAIAVHDVVPGSRDDELAVDVRPRTFGHSIDYSIL